MSTNWFFELNLAAIILLIPLGYYWRPNATTSTHPYFPNQSWALREVAICLLLIDLTLLSLMWTVYLFQGSPLTGIFLNLSMPVSPLLLIWFFFRYRQQPITAVGISTVRAFSLLATGTQWALGILALNGVILLLMSPDRLERIFASTPGLGFFGIFAGSSVWLVATVYFPTSLWETGFSVIYEEVAYRGLLYGALRRLTTRWPAMIISTTYFFLAHGEPSLPAIMLGGICAYLVEEYRSLIPGIVVHGLWNLCLYMNAWFISGVKVDPSLYLFLVTVIAGVGFILLLVTNRSRDKALSAVS